MEKVKNEEKVESIKEEKIDIQKASQIVEQEKKERINQCSKEIMVVLKKYNCDFDVTMVLGQNRILPNIQVISK